MSAALVLALAGCSSQLYVEGCERARDRLIELRFAAVQHDPDQLWQLLVELGGAENVDRRALKAALARPHDEAWFESLHNRQRHSPKSRAWVRRCVAHRSTDYAACVAGASSLAQTDTCDD